MFFWILNTPLRQIHVQSQQWNLKLLNLIRSKLTEKKEQLPLTLSFCCLFVNCEHIMNYLVIFLLILGIRLPTRLNYLASSLLKSVILGRFFVSAYLCSLSIFDDVLL